MKKVKGIELMQMIAEGKIDKKARLIFDEEIFQFDESDILDIVDESYRSIFSIYDIEKILRMDFEILDISKLAALARGELENEMNNINEFEVDERGIIETEAGSFKGRKMDIAFANKINELARAVNSLGGKNE